MAANVLVRKSVLSAVMLCVLILQEPSLSSNPENYVNNVRNYAASLLAVF